MPLAFRFHVATAGVLAVGGDLTRWSDGELAAGAGFVATYKRVRRLVQHGVQHRLRAPAEDGPTVVQYTSADRTQALVLAWQRAPRRGGRSCPSTSPGSNRRRSTGTPRPGIRTTPPS